MQASEKISSRTLWRQLAKARDAQKTRGEWEQLQGETPVFDVPLAAVVGACARLIRAPQSGIPLTVHKNWDGSFSALPPADSEYHTRFDGLTVEDVALHRIDWVGVCRDLAIAAGLAGEVAAVDEFPFLWRVGYRLGASRRRPCFFGVPHGEKEAQVLAVFLTAQKALLLVVPDADPAVSTAFADVPFLLLVSSDCAVEVVGPGRKLVDTVREPLSDLMVAEPGQRSHPRVNGPAVPAPAYALRQDLGFWTLVFEGKEARLRSEKGILYVAWLLKHPDQVPIHAIDLAGKIPAVYRRQRGVDGVVNEKTGELVPLQGDSRLQERNLGLDELEASRRHWRKQAELTAVLDDPSSTEPEKVEALKELEDVTEFLNRYVRRSKSGASDMVRSVRRAIVRFHERLVTAVDERGEPHPVCCVFAEHLAKYLLAPSSRFSGRIGSSVRAGVAGRFTYEPPEGVKWSD